MSINEIPEEVLARIIKFAIDRDHDSILKIESVCDKWQNIIDKYCLWKEVAGKNFLWCLIFGTLSYPIIFIHS